MAPASYCNQPLVDTANPLYCPEVSAHQFMSSIRLFRASVEDVSRFPFFHQLSIALEDPWDLSQDYTIKSIYRFPPVLYSGNPVSGEEPAKQESEDYETRQNQQTVRRSRAIASKRRSDVMNSDSSETIFTKPAKRIKRSSSEPEMSFVLSAKIERLRFPPNDSGNECCNSHPRRSPGQERFWPEGASEDEDDKLADRAKGILERLQQLEEKLNGQDLGPETPGNISSVIKYLESRLPGVRLSDQLLSDTATYQGIIDLLGMKGHLIPHILTLFRRTNIHTLNLSESMGIIDGLNLSGSEVLKVLKEPNSFLYLRKLVLSNIHLSGDDLTRLSDLRVLESLYLDDTQICDEAIMHLVALKHTLVHLDLAWNVGITDDAIPSLCALHNLDFLSLKGTSITVDGLRKLACRKEEQGVRTNLIVPTACEKYLYGMHTRYELNVLSPLIHDPDACNALSTSELQANLKAHASRNSEIITTGTKKEMEERLAGILERRRKDMILWSFLFKGSTD